MIGPMRWKECEAGLIKDLASYLPERSGGRPRISLPSWVATSVHFLHESRRVSWATSEWAISSCDGLNRGVSEVCRLTVKASERSSAFAVQSRPTLSALAETWSGEGHLQSYLVEQCRKVDQAHRFCRYAPSAPRNWLPAEACRSDFRSSGDRFVDQRLLPPILCRSLCGGWAGSCAPQAQITCIAKQYPSGFTSSIHFCTAKRVCCALLA